MSRTASIHHLSDPGIRERWTNLDKRSVLKTPYSSLGYVEDLADVLKLSVQAVFIPESGRDTSKEITDEAGLLFLEEHKSGIQHAGLSGYTPFSALAATRIPPSAQVHGRTSWFDVLIESLQLALAKTDLLLPPLITDIRSFQWNDWFVSPLYTYRLDVSNMAQLSQGWSDGTRRLFAKWEDDYSLVRSADSADTVVDMCLDGYGRSGKSSPLTSDQLRELAVRQLDRGTASCYVVQAKDQSAVEAGVIVLENAPDAYYWIAGGIQGPAMTVLIGKLAAHLADQGFTTFDLVGANTPSIAEFKRRFNPSLIPYFRVRHVRSRVLRIFFSLKEALRS